MAKTIVIPIIVLAMVGFAFVILWEVNQQQPQKDVSESSHEITFNYSQIKEELDSNDKTRIDVRARHLKDLEGVPIYHLFIVYVDSDGRQYYFRGGSSCEGIDSCSLNQSTIVASTGRYTSGTVDWDKSAESITVLDGKTAKGKDSCLALELEKINNAKIPYILLDQNSNSVVRTILEKCHIPAKKPVTLAPGWNRILEYSTS